MSVILILAAAAAGLGAGDTAQAGSHDAHDSEKVSFTIVGEGRGGARNARYYKVSSGGEGNGASGEAILKLVCSGGEPRHASLQVLPSQSARKKASEPLTVVQRWAAPEPALRSASFHYNIRNSDKAALATQVGWTEVKLDEAAGLCPR